MIPLTCATCAGQALRPGGHMVFYMTNYGFWAKRLVNAVLRRKAVTHAHERRSHRFLPQRKHGQMPRRLLLNSQHPRPLPLPKPPRA